MSSIQKSNSDDTSDHESECQDTLAPLPDDLLIRPHAIHKDDLHGDEQQSQNQQHNDNEQQQSPPRNTTATSKRRSLSVSGDRPIFPVRNATKQDMVHAKKILDTIQKEHGFLIPDRGDLDDPSILWKEGKPDYTIADLHYLLGKTNNHPEGSLELFVENFIKTWEMEATHKEFYQWNTVDQSAYEVQANGGKIYDSVEAPWIGNYNWLLSTCNKELYDTTKETFESSHGKFRYAFPEGFPFEVLEVFSGPPKITFTWRHWAVFSGEFEGHKGDGETINITGFGVVTVNEATKAKKIEIYYNPDGFLETLKGTRKDGDGTEGVDKGLAIGEPIAGGLETLATMMAAVGLEEEENINESGTSLEGKSVEDGKPRGKCPFSGAL